MEKLAATGRVLFGICIAALGIENLVCAQVHAPVLPVLPWLPPHVALGYLIGILLLGVGAAIAAGFRVRIAAILLAVLFVFCEVLMQVPRAAAVPLDIGVRTLLLEVLAFGGTAMTLGAVSAPSGLGGDKFLRFGRYLFAVSLLGFGLAHFLVPKFIATLIPAWIPLRLFWAYFTGAAFVATGLSILVGWLDAFAATMLGVMFLLWFLLLHAPRVLSAERSHNPDEWSSALIALGMCGASWIIAGDSKQKR